MALLEQCSEAAHNEWLAEKRRRGVTTWPNERGFEQMVPYADCPEDVKEFDRIVVGAIMRVLHAAALSTLTLADHIAAVEASGLVCVPEDPTEEMLAATGIKNCFAARAVYLATLAARLRDVEL